MLEKEKNKFTEGVIELIHKNYNTYKDINRIEADFRTEKGTTKSYNGRQVLEMLQNADDAKTDVVVIKLDREKNILSISNNGMPFTVAEGIASLMVASTSSKKKEFIGNKGLGFRSILNWVSEVKIRTKEEVVVFSEKIAKEEFKKLPINFQKELIFNNQDRLRDNEVPFAILSIPRVYKNQQTSIFETTIELNYKEQVDGEKVLDKIEEQLKLLAPEILLFLNHTNSIQITDSSLLLNKDIIREANEDLNRISVNDSTWNIEDSGEVFYKKVNDKKQYFNYKIAWQDDLSDINTKFFTHFPTLEQTQLPFLIHATFDLDPSRNHLNQSQENVDLLNEISNKIGEIAEKNIRKKIADWNAYKFLSPERISDNILLKEFYDDLHKLRNGLVIYPCTDGNYYSLQDVVFFGNDFSEFITSNNLQEYFKNLLLSIPKNVDIKTITYYTKNIGDISDNDFAKIIKNLSDNITNNKIRAEFIYLLSTDYFKKYHSKNYPLLINKKGEIIKDITTAFTPSDFNTIETPEFVSIDIIDKDLYMSLISWFKGKFTIGEPEARELQRIIKIIVNIQPYDITNITKQIISGTKEKLSNLGTSTPEEIVKEMVFVLNYNRHINKKQQPPKEIIPLLNKEGEVVNNQDLFIGEDYYSGGFLADIFDGVYSKKDYLAEPKNWDLDDDKITEDFFIWLGVNRSLKFIKETEKEPNQAYQDYVFDKTRKPDKFNRPMFTGVRIENIDVVKQLSVEKILLLIEKERLLKTQLTVDHFDVFKYKYGSGYATKIDNARSYIEYQLVQNSSFNNYIIEDEIGITNLFKQVDYKNHLFEKYNISTEAIKWTLRKLGAINSLNDISLIQFYKLFENHEMIFINGAGSQVFYKKFLEFCTKNKEIRQNENHHDFDKFYCFARKGGKGNEYELKLVSKIFYSDNNIVPQNILDDFWIINLPKRLGEQNVKKYFGVNLLQDELNKVKINNSDDDFVLNLELSKYLNKLKPYFLCYRLSSLKKKNNENEVVNLIKKLDIKLVKHCTYQINDSEENNLNENAFLAYKKTFYLKNEEARSITDLKTTPSFCDSIAEILSIEFKVKEHKNNFRAIFKDSIPETEHLILSDDLNEYLISARKLLGISTEEINFWSTIYETQNLDLPNNILDRNELNLFILNDLGLNVSKRHPKVNYKDLDNETGISLLQELEINLGISVIEIFKEGSQGILGYHLKRIETAVMDYEKYFNSCLWEKLNKDENKQKYLISSQENYGSLHNSKEIQNKLYENRFELNVSYFQIIKNEVKRTLDIEMNTIDKYQITIKLEYLKILKENNLEEIDIENAEIRSLLYFEGNEDKIKEIVALKNKNQGDSGLEENTLEKLTGQLIYSNTSKVVPKPSGLNRNTGGWNHSDKDVKRNKKSGKKAEQLVYNSLIESNEIEEVKWVSSFSNTSDKSDTKHYDIRYKSVNSKIWKYLEVKSFNGSYFHLSKSEREEGFKRGSDYEIALVMGEEIHILRDYFNESIDFEDNNLFYAAPADYVISLKIK